MGKIIIDNKSSVTDIVAMEAVIDVMKLGRVSNDDKQYCYFSTLSIDGFKLSVGAFLNKKSDRFLIMDDNN